MATLRIVLVDDHPIVRSGFRQLLELEPGWQVLAEVGSAQELAAWMLHSTRVVLVLYLSLPDADGLVMLRPLLVQRPVLAHRPDERRVGKVCVRTTRSWWSPYHKKK